MIQGYHDPPPRLFNSELWELLNVTFQPDSSPIAAISGDRIRIKTIVGISLGSV
jgi:hypothetical protein